MSGPPAKPLCELLSESVRAWRVAGTVEPAGDGAVVIGNGKTIKIAKAPQDSMFRWIVTIGNRARPALSIVAVLRQVHEAIDSEYTANRVRVAVASLVPQ